MDDGVGGSFLGRRDVWGSGRPCTHPAVHRSLRAEGSRRWFAIDRGYSGYNMQLDQNGRCEYIYLHASEDNG